MKRTPLGRGDKQLRADPDRMRGWHRRSKGLGRRREIRPASPRKAGLDRRRSKDTAAMVAAGTLCARCDRRAACFHEPLKRSRKRGSAYDPALRVPACWSCNEFAEREPDLATAEGWLIPSSTPYPVAVEMTARWLSRRGEGAA